MDFYYGMAQLIGVHTLLGLSAYVVLLTGQVSMAQAGFFAIGAYLAGMLTVLSGWHIVPAMLLAAVASAFVATAVGFPALRVKGLMLVVATLAFGEAVRIFWFNFDYQIAKGNIQVGPLGGEGFKQIRYFPENGWSTADVALFIWAWVIAAMAALWWLDRSRVGSVLRAVGEDELAAQSVGINLTAVKVSAMAIGGFIAGLGGAIYAHYTTHIEHLNFRRRAGHLRHRLPHPRRAFLRDRGADRSDLHPGLPGGGAALHGRLAEPPVRRAHRAGHECPARRAVRCPRHAHAPPAVRRARCLSSIASPSISAACGPWTTSA